MLFSDLLKIHRSYTAANSQSDILGDAFLMTENPVYRGIKQRALEAGVSFTEATTQYLLMPFNQLDQIISSRQVPFVPSARLTAEVEAKHPGVVDLGQMPIPESYHLHESAHVIAEHCCSGIAASTQGDKILKAVLCESFANTADAMACSYADSEIHRVFLKLNCYMAPTDLTLKQMRRVREALGEEFTVRLVLLSYVFANFLRDEVPAALIEDWVSKFAPAQAKPTKKVLKDCVALSAIGQRLDPLFRVQTTANYFQLQGFRGEIYDLLDFDFLERLQRQDFTEAFDALAAALKIDIVP